MLILFDRVTSKKTLKDDIVSTMHTIKRRNVTPFDNLIVDLLLLFLMKRVPFLYCVSFCVSFVRFCFSILVFPLYVCIRTVSGLSFSLFFSWLATPLFFSDVKKRINVISFKRKRADQPIKNILICYLRMPRLNQTNKGKKEEERKRDSFIFVHEHLTNTKNKVNIC